jgi:uracil-DNA glycosylase
VLVCLGATAAQALLRSDFKVSIEHGQLITTSLAPQAIATIHPSSILRQRTPADRQREMSRLTDDLRVVADLLKKSPRS